MNENDGHAFSIFLVVKLYITHLNFRHLENPLL